MNDRCTQVYKSRINNLIGEQDTLREELAETQAKLAGAHENADALLVRLGGDPEGMSDAEVWHASAKAIAETQAIARELVNALNSAGGAVKLMAQIGLSWKHADGSTVEVEGLVALLTEIQALIAKANGVLPAQNTLPPAGSAASGEAPFSGGRQ